MIVKVDIEAGPELKKLLERLLGGVGKPEKSEEPVKDNVIELCANIKEKIDIPKCKKCDSNKDVIKYGLLKKGTKKETQRWHCNNCDTRFTVGGPGRGQKYTIEIKKRGIELLKTMKAKDVLTELKKEFDVDVTRTTLYNWRKEPGLKEEETKKSLPLCACGCGKHVTKPENKYIHGHGGRKAIVDEGERPICKDCDSKDMVKDGTKELGGGVISRRWRCKDCSKITCIKSGTSEKVKARKRFEELRRSGKELKEAKKIVEKEFDTVLNRTKVYYWEKTLRPEEESEKPSESKKFGNVASKKTAIKEAVKAGDHTREEISKHLKAEGYRGKKVEPDHVGMFIYHNMGNILETVKRGDKNRYYLIGEVPTEEKRAFVRIQGEEKWRIEDRIDELLRGGEGAMDVYRKVCEEFNISMNNNTIYQHKKALEEAKELPIEEPSAVVSEPESVEEPEPEEPVFNSKIDVSSLRPVMITIDDLMILEDIVMCPKVKMGVDATNCNSECTNSYIAMVKCKESGIPYIRCAKAGGA